MVSDRYNRDRHAPNKGIAGRGAAATDRVRCVFVRIRITYLFEMCIRDRSNGLVALASALYCQYQGFADVNAGRGAIVIGLAAVIIGEVLFSRIFRNFAMRLLGVSLGAVVYYLSLIHI